MSRANLAVIGSRFDGWCAICRAPHSVNDVICYHSDPTGSLKALCKECGRLVFGMDDVDLCAWRSTRGV